jgi:hypothetical protein
VKNYDRRNIRHQINFDLLPLFLEILLFRHSFAKRKKKSEKSGRKLRCLKKGLGVYGS